MVSHGRSFELQESPCGRHEFLFNTFELEKAIAQPVAEINKEHLGAVFAW